MTTQRQARIEIVPAKDGGHFLRLRASNGRTLAHSETYASKSNAHRAVQAWIDAMADPSVTEVHQ